jgi:hypothetical protein
MNLTLGGIGNWEFLNSNSELQRDKCIRGNIKMKWLKENDPSWYSNLLKTRSETIKRSYNEGRRSITVPDWTGKTHTVETKKLIGSKNKIKQSGIKNSQYGSCWITNEKENKKIHKGDLIPDGWRLGRKINTVM